MTELQPIIGCKKTNNGGVEGIPIEIKIMAALRHLGRGEVWAVTPPHVGCPDVLVTWMGFMSIGTSVPHNGNRCAREKTNILPVFSESQEAIHVGV